MLNKTVRITMVPEVPVFLGTFENGQPRTEHILTLIEFLAKPGLVKWAIKDETGRIFEGRLGMKVVLPYYPDSFITLSVPITLHHRTQLNALFGVEFIYRIPQAKQAQDVSYLRQKYPDAKFG